MIINHKASGAVEINWPKGSSANALKSAARRCIHEHHGIIPPGEQWSAKTFTQRLKQMQKGAAQPLQAYLQSLK